MIKKTITLLLLTGLCIQTTMGFAEVVNGKEGAVQPDMGFSQRITSLDVLVRKGPDARKWFFTMGGWYERRTGNTDTMRTNGNLSLVYDDGITSFLATGKAFYGEYNGFENENNATGVLKYDCYIASRVELFFFSQAEYDRMSRLNFRDNTGAGAKFVFFRNTFWTTDVSAAPVFQYEKYRAEDAGIDARGSFRFRLKITPLNRVRLQAVFFYVPKIEDFSNYRTIFETSLDLDLTKKKPDSGLSIRFGYDRKYNNSALEGTKKLDDYMYSQVLLRI